MRPYFLKFVKTIKTITIYLVILFFIALCLGNQIAGIGKDGNKNEFYEKLDLFSFVLTLIQNSYVEQVSSKDLIYGALQGTLASLDPYSQFLTPDRFNELQVETDGEFGGLGMEVMIQGDNLVIISALPDTTCIRCRTQNR